MAKLRLLLREMQANMALKTLKKATLMKPKIPKKLRNFHQGITNIFYDSRYSISVYSYANS